MMGRAWPLLLVLAVLLLVGCAGAPELGMGAISGALSKEVPKICAGLCFTTINVNEGDQCSKNSDSSQSR